MTESKSAITFQDEDWEFILETIDSEKCVLFLGPEVFTSVEGKSLFDQLVAYLDIENNRDILSFYKEDNFFLFSSKYAKTKALYRIRKFFSRHTHAKAEALFEKIVQIPFHIVITLTPDDLLFRKMRAYGIKAQHGFYFKNNTPRQKINLVNKDAPLVYNLFGFLEQDESLILTHDDLFDFLQSIFSNNSMDDTLKYKLKTADNYIFLGLQFDKWYVQLLLRLLDMHNEHYSFVRYASGQFVKEEIRSLIYRQFRIQFVQNEIPSFIDELYQRCQQKGLLRSIAQADQDAEQEQPQSELERIRTLVRENEAAVAVDELQLFFKARRDTLLDKARAELLGELSEDFDLLSARLKRVDRKVNRNVIDLREAEIEYNQINESLLKLCKKLQAFE